MFENAKPELDRIVDLVQELPDKFQASAFEILLTAYANSVALPREAKPLNKKHETPASDPTGATGPLDGAPAELRGRLKGLAAQAKVPIPALMTLFDFSVDPFTLGSFVVEGPNTSEKARKVALLVGARSYIANGKWSADWAETKATCVDHGCYDMDNFSQAINKGRGGAFKAVTVGQSIEISASGQADAKTLLAELAKNAG